MHWAQVLSSSVLITCEMQGEIAASKRKVLGHGYCLCSGAGLKISFGRLGEWELQETYRECPVVNSQAKQHQLLAASVTLPGPQVPGLRLSRCFQVCPSHSGRISRSTLLVSVLPRNRGMAWLRSRLMEVMEMSRSLWMHETQDGEAAIASSVNDDSG